MITEQIIYRKGNFDSGHRVMNERMKCFNVHGHTYIFELGFGFSSMQEIGYAIDFKEIKRVACQWIDDCLDHGMILNPKDTELIEVTNKLKGKLWLMSLNGAGEYCNPSVENIAKEVFLAIGYLFQELYPDEDLYLVSVKLYETPNCWTLATAESITEEEVTNFLEVNQDGLVEYAKEKGVLEYDDRKCEVK